MSTPSPIQLPEQCGVMLLPDCTLFPHGGLPLLIFEPRYREMLAEALAGDCLFAVARLTGEESADPARCSAPVGTIGLIRASREQADGTSQLLLHGIIRVHFREWLRDRSFPQARIEPVPVERPPAGQAEAMALHLRDAVEEASRGYPEEVRSGLDALMHRTEDPAILADIVSQHFLRDPDERQRMLEIESLAERVSLLCRFLNERPD